MDLTEMIKWGTLAAGGILVYAFLKPGSNKGTSRSFWELLVDDTFGRTLGVVSNVATATVETAEEAIRQDPYIGPSLQTLEYMINIGDDVNTIRSYIDFLHRNWPDYKWDDAVKQYYLDKGVTEAEWAETIAYLYATGQMY